MTEQIHNKTESFAALGKRVGIVPVITIGRTVDAVPLARALVAGGLPAIEITLRTPSAIEAIKAIAEEVPDAVVGAGTVRNPEQARKSIAAGARFVVSPGATDPLLDASRDWGVPSLPGAATASEIMALAERGIALIKLFPAEPIGGIGLLKSLAAPFSDIAFCPTGGVNGENVAAYLALPNVAFVGGSWMVPQSAIEAQDWRCISEQATAACKAAGR
jgi:2-dehydro-3-deoxyphosphogluconate aldolase/(4S)-4-hydroxy-2-oxoglutarate aldolase